MLSASSKITVNFWGRYDIYPVCHNITPFNTQKLQCTVSTCTIHFMANTVSTCTIYFRILWCLFCSCMVIRYCTSVVLGVTHLALHICCTTIHSRYYIKFLVYGFWFIGWSIYFIYYRPEYILYILYRVYTVSLVDVTVHHVAVHQRCCTLP